MRFLWLLAASLMLEACADTASSPATPTGALDVPLVAPVNNLNAALTNPAQGP
jgi:hypothetical protein